MNILAAIAIGLAVGIILGVPWGCAITHTTPKEIDDWSEENER